MAKLKIHDEAGNPIPAAYILVVDRLGRHFEEFEDAGETERADMLQHYARPHQVTQLATSPDDVISSANCKIKGEKDQRKRPNKRSKVTLPLPDEWPADFDYLLSYVQAIKNENDMAQACKLLFGFMLLTRCR